MRSMHVANTLLIALLVGCGGAVTDSDVSNTAQGAVKQPTTGGGDALACAQAKDYAAEAQRVGSSVQNPLTDNFELHNEYERQASAARQEAQRLRTLAAAARRSCEGTSEAAVQPAPKPAALPSPESSPRFWSIYDTGSRPASPTPEPSPFEHALSGTLPLSDATGDESLAIPTDYTVDDLRFSGSGASALSLSGVVHAGARCASGLEILATLRNGEQPFDEATTQVSLEAGSTTTAVWVFQVSADAYEPGAMQVVLEAVGLSGTCGG